MKEKSNGFTLKAILFVVLAIVALQILVLIFPSQSASSCPSNQNQSFSSFNSTSATMFLPAVDASGNGAVTTLNVEKTSGSGRTLTDINNLLFWDDTQQSIRIAKMVAGDISGINLNNYDLVYDVQANASIIGGPSAGAALTLATISVLEGKQLNKSIMITGTINSDGSIGPVGDILEKAGAAKSAGANLFLVPLGQGSGIIYNTTKSCNEFGQADVCTTETKPLKVNITQETGIQIQEVANISDAMNYFFN